MTVRLILLTPSQLRMFDAEDRVHIMTNIRRKHPRWKVFYKPSEGVILDMPDVGAPGRLGPKGETT